MTAVVFDVGETLARGLRTGLAGNASAGAFAALELDVDFVASSAHVGDRIDNDVVPARAAGMLAVHVRRGPRGYLHDAPEGTPTIRSLAELPDLPAHA